MTKVDRRALLAGAIAFAVISQFAAAATPAPKILLVCQFGTVKSPVARELIKRRAAERGVAIAVTARGITPQQHLSVELRDRLAKEGINPAAEPLRKLGPSDVSAADIVIAFDKLPADYRPRILEDWSDLPSMLRDYEDARPELDARIEKLLDRLSHRAR